MNLTELTIKNTRIAIALFVMVVVVGVIQFGKLPQDSMPPYTIRVATVVSQFTGASPERVELLVTKPIEKRLQEIPEVKDISSQSRMGVSVVTMTLKDEVKPEKLQDIWDKARRKVEGINDLPEGVVPKVNDDSVGEVFGIILSLSSKSLSPKELEKVAKDMADQLVALNDAAKVDIQGVQEQRIYIDYDNMAIARYGLTVSKLQQIIKSTNILYSGGEVNMGKERIVLEPTGNFNSIDDLKKLIIPLPNKRTVHLGDIANVYQGYVNPPDNIVRVSGTPAISLAISLKENANIVNLGQEVDKFVADYQQTLPIGTEISRVTSLDTYVNASVDNFTNNLLQSVSIVLIVMLLFLGLRTGMIIASLVPAVIVSTFMMMGLMGVGINQVTLAALIMAMGMMVDNAVVISELIIIKMQEGKDRLTSAKEACDELMFPLLSSTLTTSLAFLAFYLAESTMGDIMGSIFVVISIALGASWILSLTLIALLCYWFIKVDINAKPRLFDRIIDVLKNSYRVFINIALRFKYLFLIAIVLALVGSLSLFPTIPVNFFADSDRNLVTMDINLAPSTRIEETEKVVKKIEKFIADDLLVSSNELSNAENNKENGNNKETMKGIVSFASFIGEGPASYDMGYSADQPNSRYAHILITTTSDKENGMVIERLDNFAMRQFPNVDIKLKRLGAGGAGQPIEIDVYGKDIKKLEEIAGEIKSKLKKIDGTKNVIDNWGMRTKKLEVIINQERAEQLGITNQLVAQTLESNLNGVSTGVFRDDDMSIPILMRNHQSSVLNADSLSEINIISEKTGESLPLSEVATINPKWQYSMQRRKNLSNVITISSQLKEGASATEVTKSLDPWLQEYAQTWTQGFHFEYGGDSKSSAENFGAVLKYLPLCGFLIFLLLVLQFNSFRKTLIVLLTIPLGLIGVVWGLILLRSYFGFMAFLGMISLAGIVINNAIVLMDRIDLELERGLEPMTAVKEACLQRFRPILLTSFTTILGLIPLYVSGGLMWEPMAAVLMVGLLIGTFISLLFVPVMYCILYRVRLVG